VVIKHVDTALCHSQLFCGDTLCRLVIRKIAMEKIVDKKEVFASKKQL